MSVWTTYRVSNITWHQNSLECTARHLRRPVEVLKASLPVEADVEINTEGADERTIRRRINDAIFDTYGVWPASEECFDYEPA